MQRSEASRKPNSLVIMWVCTVLFAVEVGWHRDPFTFWLSIVMLALVLPAALFFTYREFVERIALSRKRD